MDVLKWKCGLEDYTEIIEKQWGILLRNLLEALKTQTLDFIRDNLCFGPRLELHTSGIKVLHATIEIKAICLAIRFTFSDTEQCEVFTDTRSLQRASDITPFEALVCLVALFLRSRSVQYMKLSVILQSNDKLSAKRNRDREGILSILPATYYSELQDRHFGSQTISTILCSIRYTGWLQTMRAIR
jgi:hypothetical protein